MRVCSRWSLALAAATALCLGAAPALAGDGPLDGRKYQGETGEAGKQGEPEEFVFADGEFDPRGCHEWGFYATPYTATQEEDGTIRFVAEHTNEDGNRMRWEGTVAGDMLSGSMWYWEGDGEPSEYWFKGEDEGGDE